jgi:hypothetical protein
MQGHRSWRRGPSAALVALACALGPGALAWSCSATHDQGSTTGDTTTSGGGAGGEAGQGGSDVEIDGGPGDSGLDEDAACVKAVIEATRTQLDIALLLDRSGSMDEDDKWGGATGAIKAFISDPASQGIGMGLAFLPFDPDVSTCDYKDYEELVVPIGELPQNAAALVGAIDMVGPGGNTPMFAALKGTLLAASSHRDAHPDRKVIVLLASDGLPGSCDTNQNDTGHVAELSAGAHKYGVDTYVIAISGTDVDGLSQIAAAGGTTAAYDVTGDIGQLSQKMSEIRGAALGCELVIPAPPDKQELDPLLFNVQYFAGGGDTATLLPHASGPVDCGDAPGWYYDDNDSPTKIILCPATCDVVRSDLKARIKALFGCSTVAN